MFVPRVSHQLLGLKLNTYKNKLPGPKEKDRRKTINEALSFYNNGGVSPVRPGRVASLGDVLGRLERVYSTPTDPTCVITFHLDLSAVEYGSFVRTAQSDVGNSRIIMPSVHIHDASTTITLVSNGP